ncbi:barstar family protein [Hamadaea tsunoensis]|uniref:barstar family protein n=1 Tax=Hamadaea tsunoensis TaxID=53368 RepID=UPI001FE064FA|nr:barstar family protein [Hamadaea tsunoensis]
MSPPSLTERRSPWVVFTRCDDPWVGAETAELLNRGGSVFRLDGRELRDPGSLFTAFARELTFPSYFERNWDALVDCLWDWHSHATITDDVAIIIDDADELLYADFLGTLVSVLCQAAWKANLQLDADGNPHNDEHWTPRALHTAVLLGHTPPAAFAERAVSDQDVAVVFDGGRLSATLTGPDWPGFKA